MHQKTLFKSHCRVATSYFLVATSYWTYLLINLIDQLYCTVESPDHDKVALFKSSLLVLAITFTPQPISRLRKHKSLSRDPNFAPSNLRNHLMNDSLMQQNLVEVTGIEPATF